MGSKAPHKYLSTPRGWLKDARRSPKSHRWPCPCRWRVATRAKAGPPPPKWAKPAPAQSQPGASPKPTRAICQRRRGPSSQPRQGHPAVIDLDDKLLESLRKMSRARLRPSRRRAFSPLSREIFVSSPPFGLLTLTRRCEYFATLEMLEFQCGNLFARLKRHTGVHTRR